MYRKCRKTCNLCPTPPTQPPTTGCKDDDKLCSFYKHQGYCIEGRAPLYKAVCRKTCGDCGCKDVDDEFSCRLSKQYGECNDGWNPILCRKTCGFCTTTSNSTSKPFTPIASSISFASKMSTVPTRSFVMSSRFETLKPSRSAIVSLSSVFQSNTSSRVISGSASLQQSQSLSRFVQSTVSGFPSMSFAPSRNSSSQTMIFTSLVSSIKPTQSFGFKSTDILATMKFDSKSTIAIQESEMFSSPMVKPSKSTPVIPSSSRSFTTSPPVKDDCGLPSTRGRVIGGIDSVRGQWPWQAAIYIDNVFQCGGTLIKPNWVVTAAHCISLSDVASYKVVLGDNDRSVVSFKEKHFFVDRIVEHPQFDNMANDIALIKLSVPVRLNSYIKTICLPKEDEEVPIGSKCFTTGWGVLDQDLYSMKLKYGNLKVISNKDCNENNSKYNTISKGMVCATNSNEITTTCHGDSGGPLACQNMNGRWYLHGTTTWGSPTCNAKDAYSVFTRITEYSKWINNIIN